MKVHYLLITLFAFTITIQSQEKKVTQPQIKKKAPITAEEKGIRKDLNFLMNQAPSQLSYIEFKRIRGLISQLKKFNATDADTLLNCLQKGRCLGLSAFREAEIAAEIKELLKKPLPKDTNWLSKIEKLLTDLNQSINNNFDSCATDNREQERQYWLDPYTALVKQYEKAAGKKFNVK